MVVHLLIVYILLSCISCPLGYARRLIEVALSGGILWGMALLQMCSLWSSLCLLLDCTNVMCNKINWTTPFCSCFCDHDLHITISVFLRLTVCVYERSYCKLSYWDCLIGEACWSQIHRGDGLGVVNVCWILLAYNNTTWLFFHLLTSSNGVNKIPTIYFLPCKRSSLPESLNRLMNFIRISIDI